MKPGTFLGDLKSSVNDLEPLYLAILLHDVGKAEPVGLFVDTFGTGVVDDEALQAAITEVFDLRPAAIIRDLDLLRPIYGTTSAYGHFGRDGFAWESTDRAELLKKAAGQ